MQNNLGKALKQARKTLGWTQQRLGEKAGLSVPTVRLLEAGRGNLGSWEAALAAMELRLSGRNLPGGDALGARIALLRRRRGLGQRALAELVGISQPTLVSLERCNQGRLDVLDRILTCLGAGACLAPIGAGPGFYNHAAHSSAHHGWQTPGWVLEALYGVFGRFDLDPCSPSRDQRVAPVRARSHFTADDDGLNLAWFGTVFMNPPYGRFIGHWTAKAREEVLLGHAKTVIALVPARTDTGWWHRDIAGTAQVLFLRGRLCFNDNGQAAPFPSALVVWGGTPAALNALQNALPGAWRA